MFVVLALLILPVQAQAANVFGGRVGAALPCFNAVVWATVGPPRGGLYIWTPFTRTYPHGPPAPGKWVLGLYGLPYFCIVLPVPIFVLPGITMTIMGSS